MKFNPFKIRNVIMAFNMIAHGVCYFAGGVQCNSDIEGGDAND